jgi:ATP-dependent Clp protease ATP-binding subunit ClpC
VFERFDDHARLLVDRAFEEARTFGHGQVGTEHLLLGLLDCGAINAVRALTSCGAALEGCRAKVAEAAASKQYSTTTSELKLTDRAARALERASRLSLRRQCEYVDADHVLISVLDVEGTAGQVLRGLSVDLDCVRKTLNLGPEQTSRADPSPSGGRVPADSRGPRCPRCELSLDSTLAHQVVASRRDGESVQWLLAYCSSCGTALAGQQIVG